MTGTLQLPGRVKQTSATTGTGTLNLIAPPVYLLPFSSRYASGAKLAYVITDNASGFEWGYGTLTTGSPDTLSRDKILASSNSGAAVNWGAGTRDVFVYSPTSLSQIGVTSSTTLDETDWGNVYENTGTGAVTLTIPPVANVPRGWFVVLKNLAAAAGASAANNTTTVTATGGDTIDGFGSIQVGLGETLFLYKGASGKWRSICRDGLPLLQSAVAAGSASIVLTNFDQSFDVFEVELSGITPATNGADIWLRISQDNGATFKNGASNYAYILFGSTSVAGSYGAANSSGDTKIVLSTGFTNLAEPAMIRLRLMRPNAGSILRAIEWDASYFPNGGGINRITGSGTYQTDTNATNAIQILASTGNISAAARVYGRRAA